MKKYSTKQVLRIVGIGRTTLLRWLRAGKVPEPRRTAWGGLNARVFADRDVERVRKYKERFYRSGRGRRKSATKQPPELPNSP
jgi:DNA-binding transcriptional MerR regulator